MAANNVRKYFIFKILNKFLILNDFNDKIQLIVLLFNKFFNFLKTFISFWIKILQHIKKQNIHIKIFDKLKKFQFK
jgi:hypothetical protein